MCMELKAQLAHERDINDSLRALRVHDRDRITLLEQEIARLRNRLDGIALSHGARLPDWQDSAFDLVFKAA